LATISSRIFEEIPKSYPETGERISIRVAPKVGIEVREGGIRVISTAAIFMGSRHGGYRQRNFHFAACTLAR
jgi:hypothetical protein